MRLDWGGGSQLQACCMLPAGTQGMPHPPTPTSSRTANWERCVIASTNINNILYIFLCAAIREKQFLPLPVVLTFAEPGCGPQKGLLLSWVSCALEQNVPGCLL